MNTIVSNMENEQGQEHVPLQEEWKRSAVGKPSSPYSQVLH